jgi:hypothetical protein
VNAVIGEDVFPSDWHGTDYYTTLGVDQSATAKEIKAEYRWLAKKFHPDFNPGDTKAHERFLKIQQAYETLSDGEKRKGYDDFLKGERHPAPPAQDRQSSEHQTSTDESPLSAETKDNSWRIWAGITAGVVLLFLVPIIALSISGAPASRQELASNQTTSTPPPPVAPSSYSTNDIEACEDFLAWDIFNLDPNVTRTKSEKRAVAMRLEVEVESFFYLADDFELQRLASDYAYQAGILGIAIDAEDEGLSNIAIAGVSTADGKLRAECGKAR